MVGVWSYIEILSFIVLVPILPIIVTAKWLLYKIGFRKYVKYTVFDNFIPFLLSIVYTLLVFLWPHYSEDWSTAEDVVNFLTVVLQFLLPLQVTAAIARNQIAMQSFRKFTSKLLQIQKFKDVEVIKYMAKAAKWKFRDEVKPDLLFKEMSLKNKYKSATLPEAMIDDLYTSVINIEGDTAKRSSAIALMKEAQSAYGEIKSAAEFRVPNLFISFFYLSMAVYFLLLPYTFSEDKPWDKVFKCSIYLYVFLGLFNISLYISDPFMSGTLGMQTVTDIERQFNKKVGYVKTKGTRESGQYASLKLKI